MVKSATSGKIGGLLPLEVEVYTALAKAGVSSVVAGVSGGADSVAMLRALVACGVAVTAVHCNFHLRGAESDRDQLFVEQLCGSLGVPLSVVHVDVQAHRDRTGDSVEMACRDTRYEAFRSMLRSSDADRIAVAHNSDDQAETVLLNLMRGAGVLGLRGMLRDTGEIIRPLLSLSRKDILNYLHSIGQAFVTDSTNLESDYLRNFLRNDVLPQLRTRWPNASAAICRSATNLAQEERALTFLESQLIDDKCNRLDFDVLNKWDDPLWCVRRFAMPRGANISQCEEIVRTVMADDYQPGKCWITPQGTISAERGCLSFSHFCPADEAPHLEVEEYEASADVLARVRMAPLSELWTTLPPEELQVRRVQVGDRIRPLGLQGSTLVSKVMKDAKLSRTQKQDVWVVAHRNSGQVIWVEALKRSALFLAGETSDVVFRYTLSRGAQ